MPQSRCTECGRQRVAGGDFMLAPLSRCLELLHKAAREFDLETPIGEHYTALDFADWLETSVHAEALFTNPAGRQAKRDAA